MELEQQIWLLRFVPEADFEMLQLKDRCYNEKVTGGVQQESVSGHLRPKDGTGELQRVRSASGGVAHWQIVRTARPKERID